MKFWRERRGRQVPEITVQHCNAMEKCFTVRVKSPTSDYDQRHVIAFRPISVAARSWSYDKTKCHRFAGFIALVWRVRVLSTE